MWSIDDYQNNLVCNTTNIKAVVINRICLVKARIAKWYIEYVCEMYFTVKITIWHRNKIVNNYKVNSKWNVSTEFKTPDHWSFVTYYSLRTCTQRLHAADTGSCSPCKIVFADKASYILFINQTVHISWMCRKRQNINHQFPSLLYQVNTR